jgi:hypothetical protein
MHACLATATNDSSLTRRIEGVVAKIGLELKRMRNEDGSTLFLQAKTREIVRSARVFIAALAPKNLRSNSVINGIGIAQCSRVPVVVVSEGAIPPLEGNILGAIPKENVFDKSSPDFPDNLALRLLELAAIGPASGKGASPEYAGPWVFISYAGADKPHADELSVFLRQNNIPYWNDFQSRREYEDDFVNEIEKAIQTSITFALVLTPRWRKSKWAQDEYQFARRLGKPRFVLQFEETEPILTLASLTPIDCRTNRWQAFNDFMARVDPIALKLARQSPAHSSVGK